MNQPAAKVLSLTQSYHLLHLVQLELFLLHWQAVLPSGQELSKPGYVACQFHFKNGQIFTPGVEKRLLCSLTRAAENLRVQRELSCPE